MFILLVRAMRAFASSPVFAVQGRNRSAEY